MEEDQHHHDKPLDDEEEIKEYKIDQDPFSRLMFGSPTIQHEESNIGQPDLDYEELMVNIDKLIESARNLKPLFKQVYPLFQQFWKKG